MCNLYSVTTGQAAIIELTRALRDKTGNLPPMPGVFPDYLAPIARNAPDGVRELTLARWGMPGPPQFGGAPITNIATPRVRTGELGLNLKTAASSLSTLSANMPIPSRARLRRGLH